MKHETSTNTLPFFGSIRTALRFEGNEQSYQESRHYYGFHVSRQADLDCLFTTKPLRWGGYINHLISSVDFVGFVVDNLLYLCCVAYTKLVFPPDSYTKEGAPNEWSHKFYDGFDRTASSVVGSIDPNDTEYWVEEACEDLSWYLSWCVSVLQLDIGWMFMYLSSRQVPMIMLCHIFCYFQHSHKGFVALGIIRLLPNCLGFLVKGTVDRYVIDFPGQLYIHELYLFLQSKIHLLLLFRLYQYGKLTVRDVQHAVLSLGYSGEDLLRNCPKAPEGNEVDPSIRRMKAVLTHPIGDYAVQPKNATFAAHGVTAAHYVSGGAYTGKYQLWGLNVFIRGAEFQAQTFVAKLCYLQVGATHHSKSHKELEHSELYSYHVELNWLNSYLYSTRLTSMVRSFGGEVLIDATVRSIIIENGRAVGVRVSNTDELE